MEFSGVVADCLFFATVTLPKCYWHLGKVTVAFGLNDSVIHLVMRRIAGDDAAHRW